MRSRYLSICLSVFIGLIQPGMALAAFPVAIKPVVHSHIVFAKMTLAPLAHVRFCVENRTECNGRRNMFRGGRVRLNSERMVQLLAINLAINSSIQPKRSTAGVNEEIWAVKPAEGDCNDYAVTKRSELLARGWNPSSLLLSEVVTTTGEHHLVLVVRTRDKDLVLDNLSSEIRPWTAAPYQWVRIQTPQNSRAWAAIAPVSI